MNSIMPRAKPREAARKLSIDSSVAVLTVLREAANDVATTLGNLGGSLDGLLDSDAAERLAAHPPSSRISELLKGGGLSQI